MSLHHKNYPNCKFGYTRADYAGYYADLDPKPTIRERLEELTDKQLIALLAEDLQGVREAVIDDLEKNGVDHTDINYIMQKCPKRPKREERK